MGLSTHPPFPGVSMIIHMVQGDEGSGPKDFTCALQEGVVALWRGWVPSVIGVIPYVGLNFAVYESLKDVVLQTTGPLHL